MSAPLSRLSDSRCGVCTPTHTCREGLQQHPDISSFTTVMEDVDHDDDEGNGLLACVYKKLFRARNAWMHSCMRCCTQMNLPAHASRTHADM